MIDVFALAIACTPAVAPETMTAIVRHESAVNPYAINVNGAMTLSRQPANAQEAIDIAERLELAGLSFDAGLTQINNANVRRFGAAWSVVFEPCSNLQLGARVLIDCYSRAASGERDPQRALSMALSCYNTGSHIRGFENGYVSKVYRVASLQLKSK